MQENTLYMVKQDQKKTTLQNKPMSGYKIEITLES